MGLEDAPHRGVVRHTPKTITLRAGLLSWLRVFVQDPLRWA